MQQQSASASWWDLHVRAARGEQLSHAEQQEYEAALAQQDRAALLRSDLDELRRLRASVASLSQENAQLRARADRLDHEIRELERNLDQPTRELLGVTE